LHKEYDELALEDANIWQQGEYSAMPDITKCLEERAKKGTQMERFKLARLNLRNINLVNRNSRYGYKFIDSDFYRSDLEAAHCFMVDFGGCSLMKANFKYANLHCANLENCNLLGANFEHAKLEHINWGTEILQFKKAREVHDPREKEDLYQQAEEIYRHLRKVTEDEGLFELSGRFFRSEMVARRMQLPLFSGGRVLSKTVDLFCGYGEEPLRIIGFTLLLILVYAFCYAFSGLTYAGELIQLSWSNDFGQNMYYFFDAIYFSVVTFTTLGYGDIAPHGFSRFLASTEALMGSFTIALFVVVFVKKMIR